MPDDFVEAKRSGICGIMGDRDINNGIGNGYGVSNDNDNGNNKSKSNSNRSTWYIDANKLYVYAMMQKLPYKDFEYITAMAEHDQWSVSLYTILTTPDDSDHGYYIVCDINYTNSCKYRTEQLALLPNKKINDNELGYTEREKGRARTEKLI